MHGSLLLAMRFRGWDSMSNILRANFTIFLLNNKKGYILFAIRL